MKACPYCAESIQDAAAKCRFCGEWLDPSKRPPWAESDESSEHVAAMEPGPAWPLPPTGPPRRVPIRKQTQVWSTEADASRDVADEQPPVRGPTPPGPFPGRAEPAALEAVARRMERIKASAEVVRSALASTGVTAPPGSGAPNRTREEPPATVQRPSATAERPPVRAREVPVVRPLEPPPVRSTAASAPAPTASASESEAIDESGHDELAAEFFGGDGLDHAAESAGLSAVESLVTRHRPLPWRGIFAGAALVFAVSLVLLFTVFTDDSASVAGTNDQANVPAASEETPATPETPPSANSGADVAGQAAAGASATTSAAGSAATAGGAPSTPEPAPLSSQLAASLDKAREHYQAQELDQARAVLDKVLARAPDRPEALLLAAQVQLEQGNMDQSLQSASKCVALDPTMADCWLTLGVLRQNKSQTQGAIQAYEKYLALAPSGNYARDVEAQLRRLR